VKQVEKRKKKEDGLEHR